MSDPDVPARVRVIDYVANPGGGVRFALELLAALARRRPGVTFELISHGPALKRYADLLAKSNLTVVLIDLHPAQQTDWRFDVPPEAFDDCDIAWLPWIHRHRIPAGCTEWAVASFHDAILFQFEHLFHDLIPRGAADDERLTVKQWFASPARIAVSSNATQSVLKQLFSTPSTRCRVIPLSAEHIRLAKETAALPREWSWANEPFLLCPANISPHKNHEVLLRGVAKWGFKQPLVLTGDATHLDKCRWSRAVALRQTAEEFGFVLSLSLHGLGYVSDDIYSALLSRARALVMPTLAEGGGSFPVWEAIRRGVPVICSDIPVLREQMERMGAEVLWFDPHDPDDLASQLQRLDTNYPHWKRIATDQVSRVTWRTWDEVAEEYWRLFERTSDKDRARPVCAPSGRA